MISHPLCSFCFSGRRENFDIVWNFVRVIEILEGLGPAHLYVATPFSYGLYHPFYALLNSSRKERWYALFRICDSYRNDRCLAVIPYFLHSIFLIEKEALLLIKNDFHA